MECISKILKTELLQHQKTDVAVKFYFLAENSISRFQNRRTKWKRQTTLAGRAEQLREHAVHHQNGCPSLPCRTSRAGSNGIIPAEMELKKLLVKDFNQINNNVPKNPILQQLQEIQPALKTQDKTTTNNPAFQIPSSHSHCSSTSITVMPRLLTAFPSYFYC